MQNIHKVEQDDSGTWYVLKNGRQWTKCMSKTQADHLLKLIQEPARLPHDDNIDFVVGELLRINKQ